MSDDQTHTSEVVAQAPQEALEKLYENDQLLATANLAKHPDALLTRTNYTGTDNIRNAIDACVKTAEVHFGETCHAVRIYNSGMHELDADGKPTGVTLHCVYVECLPQSKMPEPAPAPAPQEGEA